jgi:hypothetical protein
METPQITLETYVPRKWYAQVYLITTCWTTGVGTRTPDQHSRTSSLGHHQILAEKKMIRISDPNESWNRNAVTMTDSEFSSGNKDLYTINLKDPSNESLH